jgi:hypothetical protein
VKPNFQRPLPGGRRGDVVAVVLCAECHAERRGRHGYGPDLELGKVLRDAEGETWVNRRARPLANYADLRPTTGKRFEAPPVVASGPVAGAVIWCPVHGDRPPLDAELVAGLAVSWPPKRLQV